MPKGTFRFPAMVVTLPPSRGMRATATWLVQYTYDPSLTTLAGLGARASVVATATTHPPSPASPDASSPCDASSPASRPASGRSDSDLGVAQPAAAHPAIAATATLLIGTSPDRSPACGASAAPSCAA